MERLAYSPSPPADQNSQEKKDSMPASETGQIAYFEQAKDKSWRICRVDYWWPEADETDARRAKMLEQSKRYAAGHKFLEDLVRDHRVLLSSTRYLYDPKGRITRVEIASFSNPEKSTLRVTDCRRYDDNDRVVLWVNPKATNKCPEGEPAPADTWRQFKFADANEQGVELLQRWHVPKEAGKWVEEWSPIQLDISSDAVRGHAKVDSMRGLKEIYGSTFGSKDNNAANMVVDVFGRWNGSTYYFTKPPVPISVLQSPSELYGYERRRMTRLDNDTRMFELFKPNEHISRHRIYMLADVVLRHEQLDEKGRVTRIITVNDWRQPRPGPKPDFDDKRLSTKAPRLMAHQIYHRVYDVDVSGRPTLVAASWNRSVRNPLKSTPLTMADLVFGTPDGKQKWKNREEFNQAFNTSENGRPIFPESSGGENDD